MKKSLDFLDNIIEMEERKDLTHKRDAAKIHDLSNVVGESQILFHLKELKKLIIEESTIVKNGLFQGNGFVSPPMPDWAEKLPTTLDIGKRVEVVKGSWTGWKGTVRNHYICGDDCSGTWGQAKYEIEKDNGERFSYIVRDCRML